MNDSVIEFRLAAMDSNRMRKLTPLLLTLDEQPHHHHFGLTLLGIEFRAFNSVGSAETATRWGNQRARVDRQPGYGNVVRVRVAEA